VDVVGALHRYYDLEIHQMRARRYSSECTVAFNISEAKRAYQAIATELRFMIEVSSHGRRALSSFHGPKRSNLADPGNFGLHISKFFLNELSVREADRIVTV